MSVVRCRDIKTLIYSVIILDVVVVTGMMEVMEEDRGEIRIQSATNLNLSMCKFD